MNDSEKKSGGPSKTHSERNIEGTYHRDQLDFLLVQTRNSAWRGSVSVKEMCGHVRRAKLKTFLTVDAIGIN